MTSQDPLIDTLRFIADRLHDARDDEPPSIRISIDRVDYEVIRIQLPNWDPQSECDVMSIAAGVQLILRRVDTGETCAPPEGMALKIVNALKREEVLGLLHEGRQSSRREFASHSLSNLAALWSTHPEYQALETARG